MKLFRASVFIEIVAIAGILISPVKLTLGQPRSRAACELQSARRHWTQKA